MHISIYSFRILCSSYHSNICSNSAQYQKLFLELTKSTVKACYFYSHIKIQNHTILYHIQSDPIHCHFQRGLFNHLQSASLSDPFIIYLCCHPSFNSACVSLTQNFLMASQLLRIQKKKKTSRSPMGYCSQLLLQLFILQLSLLSFKFSNPNGLHILAQMH